MMFTHRTRAGAAALAAFAILAAALPAGAAALPAGAAALPAGAAALPAGAAARPAGGDPLGRFSRQSPAWHSCVRGPEDAPGKELEAVGGRCAEVTVPLDYARPGGRTLTVAVARVPATDTAHRAGTLVVNEGGPADPVIENLTARRAAMKDVGARYDLVGVDPRFTGRNTSLDCGWTTASYFRWAGTDRAGFDRMAAFERDLATRCREQAGDLLPYASTRNAARDMDLVRGVLGERRISYLGISYGTYLGEVYTAMFPGRTDRVVLDGVHEPGRLAPWPIHGTEQAHDDALRDWADRAAAHHGTYGLGGTADAVLATVARIQTAAVERPLTVGTYRLDQHVVPLLLLASLGDDTARGDAYVAGMVRTLRQAAGTGRAEPDELLAELLPELLTAKGSPYGSTQTAYLCADTPGPRDVEVFRRAVERSRARHPLFGPLLNDVTPCAFWTPSRERPTVVDNDVPALLLNATGDPRVPYATARAMRARWHSSRLVIVEGSFRHGVYGAYGNACVDDTVNAYLADGRLPGADRTCVVVPEK
ncbi:alpha/beta hydrolase [Streptomyces sp. ISL-11]|uniref:alpha/beta hydrolase n=1 Tax=Streptomyces sp. ISL-11 TaxID=2819174 RepID=UPI001BE9A7F0|nr:alpha/beta hydrolase [Streptomyces sp. ISL-11]MBT2382981.1 alpha/beta hydrolase [Streptomyces sp. ISL-11]